jgi:membrane-associated HD superfamily phosphohydrolase
MFRKLVIGLVLLWIFSSIIIYTGINDNIDNIKNKSILVQEKQSDTNFEYLKIYLSSTRETRLSWIARKEIAAWSAVILFLTIIMTLSRKINFLRNNRVISILILILFTIFISLFIHQQYGQMFNSLASQQVLDKYIFKIVSKDSSLYNIDFSLKNGRVLPDRIEKEIFYQQGQIRQLNILQRFFLPSIKIYTGLKGNDNFSTGEVEEGILYNLIFISFIALFLMILLPEKIEDKDNQIKIYGKTSITIKKNKK